MIPAKLLFSFPMLPLGYDILSWPFVTMAKWEIVDVLSDLPAGSQVLDVGTGTGAIARHMAATLLVQVTGVDLSPQMLARARSLNGQVTWVEGIAEDLPVSGPYDAVVASYLLRHIAPERTPLVFSEMARVARPGGRLVLVDLQLPRPGPTQLLGVWSLYAPQALIELAQQSGFHYEGHRLFPLSILMTFERR